MTLSTLQLALEASLLLLCCAQGLTASLSINLCKECHVNATCTETNNKLSCICNLGFIGNGRTHCLDKDECQVGSHKVCGEHTACSNTHGSYYCTCLQGYRPSNNNDDFIPNDGTFCKDIDECEVSDICGYNGKCTNIPGSYECYCNEGYRLLNGTEPFKAIGAHSLCKEADCEQPPARPHSKMVLSGKTTFGNHVTYMCEPGFLPDLGSNTSVCTSKGTWEGATLVCKDIDECAVPKICGAHEQCKNFPGSYECYCKEGYRRQNGTGQVKIQHADSSCRAVDCGQPPALPFSEMILSGNTTFGSQVTYKCIAGFFAKDGHTISVCTANGTWDGASIVCAAVDCGPPPSMPYAEIHSFQNTTFGSIVIFTCSKGFIAVTGSNTSICTAAGRWEGADLECKVADCGPPPSIQYAITEVPQNTTYGSQVPFECSPGYIMDSGNKYATCNEDGEWTGANLVCREVDCGTPLNIDHADWLWNNRSAMGSYVFYKCKPGFKDNGGKNFSQCLENATWEGLNLTCTVKEDIISKPLIFNETCLKWKKSSDIFGWEILYEFSIFGVRWNDRDFVDKKTFRYITDNEYPAVCLELLPDTNYTVTMTVVSSELPAIRLNITVHTTMKQTFGNIVVFNETCLTWMRSFSPVRSLEIYRVFIQGRTWSQKGSLENIMFNFSTSEVTPVLCLQLPSAAEYMINITESSTERSAHVNLNMTTYERAKPRNQQTFNKTCLWGNTVLDGLREIYKLYVQGGKWYPKELFQDLQSSINIAQNISAICLDITMDTQHRINVTGAMSNLAGGEPIQNVTVFNETCLIWRRHSSFKELYVFFVHGHRRYQKEFIHRLMLNVTTDEEQPIVCLELQKGTNYTVDFVSTFYPQFPAQVNIVTPISESSLPKFKRIKPEHNQLLKFSFQRMDKNGPISSYQVFVIQLTSWCSFTCESLEAVTYFNNTSNTQGYVTAEFFPGDVSNHTEFSVGDRQYYGDFYNAPLERGKDYCIILRTITKMRSKTCMVMAEVEELPTSRHHMTVVLLGSIAFVCFVLLTSYSMSKCCNR